jgi:hypothetical protein
MATFMVFVGGRFFSSPEPLPNPEVRAQGTATTFAFHHTGVCRDVSESCPADQGSTVHSEDVYSLLSIE